MTSFTIYSVGGGPVLAKVLNAVAMLVSEGSTLKALIRLGMFTGLLTATISAYWRMNIAVVAKNWAIPAFIMLNLCFTPRASVNIIDTVGGRHVHKVDNVPWLLGAVAGTTSTVFHKVTEKFEQAFSEVDDLQYTKTGVMFGSQLVKKSKMFKITDRVFDRNLKSFINQCVTFAALRGVWYTVDDLKHTEDLWGLVSGKSNFVIHFPWKEPGKPTEMCPCREGINRFNTAWGGVVTQGFKDYGPRFFPHVSAERASQELKRHLPLAFEQMLSLQKSAEELMQHQMMAYATAEAIHEKNEMLGNPTNYALVRGHLTQEMAHRTMWGMACENMPAMKAVFEALIYACLLFVIPLAFLPEGYKVVGLWMGLVFWVHLWTPLFAIIYGLVTCIGSWRAASQMGWQGYSLYASVGLTELQSSISNLAGSLAMSIPFLSYALVKGGASSFVTLAGHLGSVTQGISSQAAHEGMTGNVNAGNLHLFETQIWNSGGMRHDHGASYTGDTFTQNDGQMSMQTAADGSFIAKQNSSHMQFKMDASKAYSGGLSEQAQQSATMGNQQMVSASQSEADSYRKTLDYALNHSKSIQNSDSWSQNESTNRDKAFNKIHSLAEDFAKQNDITTEKSAQILADASLGGKVGMVSGAIGAKYSASGEEHELFQKAQKFSQDHRFEDSLKEARHAAIEGRFNESDETQRRLAEDISGSFEQANQFRTEAQKHYQDSETYSKHASYAENNSASINRDHTQDFMEWLSSQSSDQGNGPMGMHHALFVAGHPGQKDTLKEHQERYLSDLSRGLIQHVKDHPASSPEQVFSSFQGTEIKNPVSKAPMEQVRMEAVQKGSPEFEDFKVPSHVKNSVNTQVAQDKLTVENQGQSVIQRGEARVQDTEKGLGKNIIVEAFSEPVRNFGQAVYDFVDNTFNAPSKMEEAIKKHDLESLQRKSMSASQKPIKVTYDTTGYNVNNASKAEADIKKLQSKIPTDGKK